MNTDSKLAVLAIPSVLLLISGCTRDGLYLSKDRKRMTKEFGSWPITRTVEWVSDNPLETGPVDFNEMKRYHGTALITIGRDLDMGFIDIEKRLIYIPGIVKGNQSCGIYKFKQR